MYVDVLPFENINLLTYFQIKIIARVDEAGNVLDVFYKDSAQYAYGFSYFSLKLYLQYA